MTLRDECYYLCLSGKDTLSPSHPYGFSQKHKGEMLDSNEDKISLIPLYVSSLSSGEQGSEADGGILEMFGCLPNILFFFFSSFFLSLHASFQTVILCITHAKAMSPWHCVESILVCLGRLTTCLLQVPNG